MSLCLTSVKSLYASVIEGVIGGVREYFLDEGVDEQVLMELKHIWETRLKATKAIEVKPEKEPQPPPLKTTTPASGKTMLSQFLAGGGQTALPTEIATKTVSIQITLPAQQGVADSQPRSITIQVPATALQDNQLQTILTGPIISAAMALPQPLATSLLQQHVTTALSGQATVIQQQQPIQQTQTTNGQTVDALTGQQFITQPSSGIRQLDGQNDTSDDDDEDDENDEEENDDDDDDDADDKDDEENDENDGGIEEEPLNSGDDVSEEDPSDMFDTDNVVVCQYDKITRTRNKWKFYLKDGIMNLGGKDYVFQKSNGDAEW